MVCCRTDETVPSRVPCNSSVDNNKMTSPPTFTTAQIGSDAVARWAAAAYRVLSGDRTDNDISWSAGSAHAPHWSLRPPRTFAIVSYLFLIASTCNDGGGGASRRSQPAVVSTGLLAAPSNIVHRQPDSSFPYEAVQYWHQMERIEGCTTAGARSSSTFGSSACTFTSL